MIVLYVILISQSWNKGQITQICWCIKYIWCSQCDQLWRGQALAESWNAAFMESSAKENQVMMRFLSHSFLFLFLCLSRFISLSRCWVIVWWFFWETWMSRWRLIQQMFSIWMMISPSYYWVSHLETFFQTLTEGVCSSVSRQISAGVMLVSLGFVTWRFVLMESGSRWRISFIYRCVDEELQLIEFILCWILPSDLQCSSIIIIIIIRNLLRPLFHRKRAISKLSFLVLTDTDACFQCVHFIF